IAHVGFGAASTESTLFKTEKLNELVDTLAEPRYRGFMFEGMGSIVRIYEPGLFKFMCGQLGLIPKNAGRGPDKTGFFSKFFDGFTPDMQWEITQGHDRLGGCSEITVYKAIVAGCRF